MWIILAGALAALQPARRLALLLLALATLLGFYQDVLAWPVLLLYCAVLLGGLAFERHTPDWLGPFMLANLFFVSLAEEALFRGYLQQRLKQVVGGIPALLLSALLFGLVHLSGGLLLVIFATLAGLLYGLAWHWSGRLWLATALHFGLNLTHLLFFTYPALHH